MKPSPPPPPRHSGVRCALCPFSDPCPCCIQCPLALPPPRALPSRSQTCCCCQHTPYPLPAHPLPVWPKCVAFRLANHYICLSGRLHDAQGALSREHTMIRARWAATLAVGETVILRTSLHIPIETPTRGRGGGCSRMTVSPTARPPAVL